MSNEEEGCNSGCMVALALNAFLWAVILVAIGFVAGWSSLSFHGLPVL